MVELGLLPSIEAAKADYDGDIRNGLLTQMVRIQPGKTITQAHMRSRAMVSHWVYEKGLPENVIAKEVREGKTYFVIKDYQKLRALYGKLLAEIQRITSEGDYEAAKALVETYGVNLDPGAAQGSPGALRQAEPGPLHRLHERGLRPGRGERQDGGRQGRVAHATMSSRC